ncbi:MULTISPECIES: DUF3499 family protein [unclassified Leucobacter]|uniref:DUF3499 family protein n=1 Tax=unclassified Leucobacter TaxID=2621730 RepID=UPI00165E2DBE|nr:MULTISPECIES: DUF3499 family protein [unclassified Leucobacter]MBC9927557.1 DUF3499 family protein [Leucobacter sp. cx-169]MBC9936633.1 DUF3499 family protein [Leucobacter sp. cx-87]
MPALPAPAVDRRCAKPACQRIAAATLTMDYASRIVALGPLSPERTPDGQDLCAVHHDRLTPPGGWELIRHDGRRAAHAAETLSA